MILDSLVSLKPTSILDIGCGCGSFTLEMARSLESLVPDLSITAIDMNPGHIQRAAAENSHPGIGYSVADGGSLPYSQGQFQVVVCRYVLHHLPQWQNCLRKAWEISSSYLLIEEPVDQIRYPEKAFFMEAQDFFLQIQAEAGIFHLRHFERPWLLDELNSIFGEDSISWKIQEKDDRTSFDEFFSIWSSFAEKTPRPDFWRREMEKFRKLHGHRDIISADCLFAMIPSPIRPDARQL